MIVELHYNNGVKNSIEVEAFYDAEDIIKFDETLFIYEDVIIATEADSEILVFKEAIVKEIK